MTSCKVGVCSICLTADLMFTNLIRIIRLNLRLSLCLHVKKGGKIQTQQMTLLSLARIGYSGMACILSQKYYSNTRKRFLTNIQPN